MGKRNWPFKTFYSSIILTDELLIISWNTGLPRKKSGLPEKKCLIQSNIRRTRSSVSSSQPVPSTSTGTSTNSRVSYASQGQGHRYSEGPFNQRSQDSLPDPGISEEQNRLVSSLIRYLFAMGREKQAINKSRMMKTVFVGQGKHFHQILNKAKTHLSKVQTKHQFDAASYMFSCANACIGRFLDISCWNSRVISIYWWTK